MIEPTESESRAELDRFADALISIKNECEQILQGKWDKQDNPLVMSPHTAAELCADEWKHPYSRTLAAFPLPYVAENKFFPAVSKIDNGYGDRNLLTVNE
jgi:glycine dehydrogenase